MRNSVALCNTPGGEGALAALVAAYGAQLTAYATRCLGDPDAAADVVQDVFVRIWRRRAALGEPLSAASDPAIRWMLFRAVRNRVIDEVRGRRRARVAERHLEMAVEPPATPVQVVDAVLLGRATERAIRALPVRRRTVFTLAHVHGLSHAEVGETLGIAPQTVANHMSLALADLRAALRPYLTPAA